MGLLVIDGLALIVGCHKSFIIYLIQGVDEAYYTHIYLFPSQYKYSIQLYVPAFLF